MSEPRVRLIRHHSQLSFGSELRQMLRAYGDTTPHSSFPQEPNTETVRVLDEMITDFIIETCHAAAQVATIAGRQKVKAEDFQFAVRKNPLQFGRVQELFRMEREIKDARKVIDANDDDLAGLKKQKKNLDEDKEDAASTVDGEKKKKKKRGKGRPKSTNKVTKRRA